MPHGGIAPKEPSIVTHSKRIQASVGLFWCETGNSTIWPLKKREEEEARGNRGQGVVGEREGRGVKGTGRFES